MTDYATQQRNLRNKAKGPVGGSSSGPALDHFEQFEVSAKTSFGLLGDMAGQLFAKHKTATDSKLSGDDYLVVAQELFEDLCTAVDVPPSVFGQCVNVADKLVNDSRPKKIKAVTKLDSATAEALENDNMGEDDEAAAAKRKRAKGGADEDGGAGEEGDQMLTAEDLDRIAELERVKLEAEAKEAERQRKALEEERRKQELIEENERKMKEQARKVEADVPIGMSVMKRDDDDDLMGFAAMGGGKKKGKGGRR